MEIRIYFEGNKILKPGFKRFFTSLDEAARQVRSTIEFIPAKNGVSDYRKALRAHPDGWNILLKDSEEPWPANPSVLCQGFGINASCVNDVFWMVAMMESWFLADPEALAAYYGREFSTNAIGATGDVERIPKLEVINRLKSATKNTSKGEYHKVKHAPYLLERLDAERVQQSAVHCRQLFEAVSKKLV